MPLSATLSPRFPSPDRLSSMILPQDAFLPRSGVAQVPLVGVRAETGTEFAREWANPSAVVAVTLMLVGGNVVHEALAQTTGKLFTPVCFSFGWVGYALARLKHVFGEGRLLPPADYPVKVFNLGDGYCRVNKNWLLGRIVRDHEAWISRVEPLRDGGIRIAIFEAMPAHPHHAVAVNGASWPSQAPAP